MDDLWWFLDVVVCINMLSFDFRRIYGISSVSLVPRGPRMRPKVVGEGQEAHEGGYILGFALYATHPQLEDPVMGQG